MKESTRIRIDYLRNMSDGWLDGDGYAPSKEGLDWLEGWLEGLPSTPHPYIYPMFDGGIQIEWTRGDWELSLEIDLAQRKGSWHGLNMSSDEEEMRDLNLTEMEDNLWIVAKLQS